MFTKDLGRQMQTDDRKLLSPNNAARVLDISRSKIYDLMKTGVLRYVTIGTDRRIPAEEIQRIASEGAVKAGAPTPEELSEAMAKRRRGKASA